MQKILGYIRKAVTDYNMIQEGDSVAVGVSGGKDSVALLEGLCRLREFIGIKFQIYAITIDPCFNGKEQDFSGVQSVCDRWGVDYTIKRSDLWEIIFVRRGESNPCSLCARMRRGMLHDMAKELGCNKLALGHNYDDAVETFIMNLFYEGRVGCFSPVTYLSRKDLTMIRPLIFAPEKHIISSVRRCKLPVVAKTCPVDGITARQKTKKWLMCLWRKPATMVLQNGFLVHYSVAR